MIGNRREISSRSLFYFFAVAVFTVAIVLRLYRLDFQSFWGDELVTWLEAWAPDFATFKARFSDSELTPPLYFLLQFLIARVVPASESSLRVLSCMAGLGFVVGTGLFASRMTTKTDDRRRAWAGLAGAAFAAVSYRAIYMSREARCYSLLSMFAAWAGCTWMEVDFRAREWRTSRPRPYIIFALLMCYTHYYGVLLVLAQAVTALFLHLRSSRAWRNGAITYGLIFLGYLPWLIALIVHGLPETDQVWGVLPLSEFFVAHRELFGASAVNSLLSITLTLLAITITTRSDRPRLLAAFLWLPLVFIEAWFISKSRSIWAERYFIGVALAPALALSAVGAVSLLPDAPVANEAVRRKVIFPKERRSFSIFLIILFCLFCLHETFIARHFYTQPRNEQLREATHEVVNQLKLVPSAQLVMVNFPAFTTDYYMARENAEKRFPRNIISSKDDFLCPEKWPEAARNAETLIAFVLVYEEGALARLLSRPIPGYSVKSRMDFYLVSVLRLEKSH